MVKDRLEELKKRSQQVNGSKKTHISIELEDDNLKNVFNLTQQIAEEIEKISENAENCRCYLREIAEFPYKEKDLSEKLTEIFQQNGKLTQNLTVKFKKLENFVKTTNKTCTIGRIETIQYNTLKTRFRECLRKNNEEMENFRNFRLNTYKAQLKAKGMDVNEDEFLELLHGDQQLFIDNLLVETAEARRLLSEAEELNEQLLKIEKLITEIRDLFVQMSVLVDEQQELIDVVEYQTQKTVDYIVKTPGILREAERKKRRALKMKIICFGILIIIIGIFVISLIYS